MFIFSMQGISEFIESPARFSQCELIPFEELTLLHLPIMEHGVPFTEFQAVDASCVLRIPRDHYFL